MINQRVNIIDSIDPADQTNAVEVTRQVHPSNSVEAIWKLCQGERNSMDYAAYQKDKKLRGISDEDALQFEETLTFAKIFQINVQFGRQKARHVEATILDTVEFVLFDELGIENLFDNYIVTIDGQHCTDGTIKAAPNMWIQLTKKRTIGG